MGIKLGMNAVLNYKEDGQDAGGSWVESGQTSEVTLELSKEMAEVLFRGNAGWMAKVGTIKDAPVKFKLVWNPDEPEFAVFLDSFTAGTVVGLQILDEDSGQGIQGDYEISKFSTPQEMKGVLMVDVEAELKYSATPPSWIGA